MNVGNIILIVMVAAIVILVALNWNTVTGKNKKDDSSKKLLEKSGYEKCLEDNSTKKDGEECSICVQPGHSEIYEPSVIVNGKCEAIVPNEFKVEEFTYYIKKGDFYKKNNIEAFKIDGNKYREAYLKYRSNKIEKSSAKK